MALLLTAVFAFSAVGCGKDEAEQQETAVVEEENIEENEKQPVEPDYVLQDAMMAAFFSSLAVAFLSQIFARLLKAPVTVFWVPGILPTVPGGSIYRSVYYFIRNNSNQCNYYLLQTLKVAGAIAMAIFVTDSVFRMIQYYQNRKMSIG